MYNKKKWKENTNQYKGRRERQAHLYKTTIFKHIYKKVKYINLQITIKGEKREFYWSLQEENIWTTILSFLTHSWLDS